MGRKSQRKGMYGDVWLIHFAVQWRTQQYKATMLQKKKITKRELVNFP